MFKKILILGVPRMEPHRPPVAPVIIGTVCKNLGYNVEVRDLNIEFYKYCQENKIDYYSFNPIWDRYTDPTAEYNFHSGIFLDKFFKDNNDYDLLMISVFSVASHLFTLQILEKISPNRNFKIVVGGAGAFSNYKSVPFVDYLNQHNLIDFFIKGEAEVALPHLLEGLPFTGINNYNTQQLDNLDNNSILDYGLVNLDPYDYLDNVKSVYIEGSRGCVRDCTYCDVGAYWPKYRYRSGNHIAKEIIHNYENFGIKSFYFTDSLVNGSFKAFDEMCTVLANYKYADQIKWKGQFIFRDKRTVKPEYFEKIKKAGGEEFFVGLETGSDKIRKEMGKGFTNDDTEYHLEHFSKNRIKVTFLMFPGYVTETIDDHNETLKLFPRWQKFVADGTITAMEFGSPLIFLSGTPIERKIDEWGIKFMNDKPNHWYSTVNPDLDFPERVRRQCELYEAAIKYKFPIWRLTSRAESLYESLKYYYDTEPKRIKSARHIPIAVKANV